MPSNMRTWKKIQRSLLVVFIMGGTLFQTSCSTMATNITVNALTSITSTYITNAVYEWLGLGGSLYSLSSML